MISTIEKELEIHLVILVCRLIISKEFEGNHSDFEFDPWVNWEPVQF